MYAPSSLFILGFITALQMFSPAAGLQKEGTVLTGFTNQNEIVERHNEFRRGVQPTASNMLKMSWNSEAEANAERWAETCAMANTPSKFSEISTSGCGENLYMSSRKTSWTDVLQRWYDEVKNFKYGVGSISGGMVGLYTQVVWYRSNEIGCAVAHCPNSKYKYFYVCHYCPPGNYELARPYKAGPSCGDCPNDCNNNLCTNPCPHTDQYSNCPELKKDFGCDDSEVASWCPASCKCTNQIF